MVRFLCRDLVLCLLSCLFLATQMNCFVPKIFPEFGEQNLTEYVIIGQSLFVKLLRPPNGNLKNCYLFNTEDFDLKLSKYQKSTELEVFNLKNEKWSSEIIYPITNNSCTFKLKRVDEKLLGNWIIGTTYTLKLRLLRGRDVFKFDHLQIIETE